MKHYPVIDFHKTGLNLYHLRESRGLTIKNIQEVLGLEHPQAIYKWENGQSLPSIDHLLVLSRLFHIRVDQIIIYDLIDLSDRDQEIC